MYPKLDYNLETDFIPVGLIASVPQVIVVNPQRVPVTDLKGLLDYAAQEPGQAELRLGRQRHLAPPGRRAVQAADQDLHHPHPLPRRRPGAAGPDRRPGGHDVRRPGLVGHAHQGGRIKALAVAADQARAGLPRGADHRRGGPARLRGRDLVRPVGAQGHAQGRGRAHAQAELPKALATDELHEGLERPRRRDARPVRRGLSASSSAARSSAGPRSSRPRARSWTDAAWARTHPLRTPSAARGRVTLANPGKHNAIDIAMWRELRAMFEQLAGLPRPPTRRAA